MSELDYATLRLSVAMKNPMAIERKVTSDYEKLITCNKKWSEMAKMSTQKKKLLCLARR